MLSSLGLDILHWLETKHLVLAMDDRPRDMMTGLVYIVWPETLYQ